MLVPLRVALAVGESVPADVMCDPGPYTSTHSPKLLNHEYRSRSVAEPLRGENAFANELSLAWPVLRVRGVGATTSTYLPVMEPTVMAPGTRAGL